MSERQDRSRRLSRRGFIAGVGRTAQGTLPGRTALDLGLDAFRRALDDAGLDKSEVDGVLTHPGTTSREGALHYLRFCEAAGIDPTLRGEQLTVADFLALARV